MDESRIDVHLAVKAGRLLEARGWTDAKIVGVDNLETEAPGGVPLVVLADRPLTTADARLMASLAGAGRTLALVLEDSPDQEVAKWLPPGLLDAGRSQSELPAPQHGVSDTAHRPVFEPPLGQFPALNGTARGDVVRRSATAEGLRLDWFDWEPRGALGVWDSPGRTRCAIWVFADPAADASADSFVVETVVGFDPDASWISAEPPMSRYLLAMLAKVEDARTTSMMQSSSLPGARDVGLAMSAMDQAASMSAYLSLDDDDLQSSLFTALSGRRVAVRAPDHLVWDRGRPEASPLLVAWVGYRVTVGDGGLLPLRLAMDLCMGLLDVAVEDPLVQSRMRSPFV